MATTFNLQNFDQSVIDKYCSDYPVDRNTATNHFISLQTFLRKCATSDYPCFPDKIIDNAWHTFLLFTSKYQEYCFRHFNKFIHHNPITDSKAKYFGYYCRYNPQNKYRLKRKLREITKAVCDGGGGDNCNTCKSY